MPPVSPDIPFVFALVALALVELLDVEGLDLVSSLVGKSLRSAAFRQRYDATVLAVFGLLYVVTALLTNVISNNASVVLMVPVAFQAASTLDASVFSFVLAVTFAASTAFMTPVGYQTNLFVYGPGGYTFMDYVKVGAPLQLLVAVVTTVGIWGIFGV